MLKNFLIDDSDNTLALEAISSMAIMMDEDPSVACESDESAQGVVSRFKGKVSAIVAKITAFIKKIVDWIKTKFFELTKKDLEINDMAWKDAQEVLKLCDKAQASFMTVLMAKIKATVAVKKEDMEGLMNAKAQIESSIDDIKKSQAYSDLFGSNSKYNNTDMDYKAKLTSVKGSSLNNQKEKFQKALETLQEEAKKLEADLAKVEDGAAKRIEVAMSAVNLNIQITNIRVATISKIMALSKEKKATGDK